jgi:hypothetical protein
MLKLLGFRPSHTQANKASSDASTCCTTAIVAFVWLSAARKGKSLLRTCLTPSFWLDQEETLALLTQNPSTFQDLHQPFHHHHHHFLACKWFAMFHACHKKC